MSGRASRQAFSLPPSLPPPPVMLTICLLPLCSQLCMCEWKERETKTLTKSVCVCVWERERERERERESKTERAYLTVSTLSLTNRFRTTFARALTRNKGIFVSLRVTSSSVTLGCQKNINTQQKSCFVLYFFVLSVCVWVFHTGVALGTGRGVCGN